MQYVVLALAGLVGCWAAKMAAFRLKAVLQTNPPRILQLAHSTFIIPKGARASHQTVDSSVPGRYGEACPHTLPPPPKKKGRAEARPINAFPPRELDLLDF